MTPICIGSTVIPAKLIKLVLTLIFAAKGANTKDDINRQVDAVNAHTKNILKDET